MLELLLSPPAAPGHVRVGTLRRPQKAPPSSATGPFPVGRPDEVEDPGHVPLGSDDNQPPTPGGEFLGKMGQRPKPRAINEAQTVQVDDARHETLELEAGGQWLTLDIGSNGELGRDSTSSAHSGLRMMTGTA